MIPNGTVTSIYIVTDDRYVKQHPLRHFILTRNGARAMPPSANQEAAAPPVRAVWFEFAAGHARSLRKLIGPGADGPSGQDWASSPKARQKSRRPVWE